jgi:hypothetical protein
LAVQLLDEILGDAIADGGLLEHLAARPSPGVVFSGWRSTQIADGSRLSRWPVRGHPWSIQRSALHRAPGRLHVMREGGPAATGERCRARSVDRIHGDIHGDVEAQYG